MLYEVYRDRYPKAQLPLLSCLIVAGKKSGAVSDAPEIVRNNPPNFFYLKETPFMKREGTAKKAVLLLCLKEQRHRPPGPLTYLRASCIGQNFTSTASCFRCIISTQSAFVCIGSITVKIKHFIA